MEDPLNDEQDFDNQKVTLMEDALNDEQDRDNQKMVTLIQNTIAVKHAILVLLFFLFFAFVLRRSTGTIQPYEPEVHGTFGAWNDRNYLQTFCVALWDLLAEFQAGGRGFGHHEYHGPVPS